jgi:hypothetical protein
MVGMVIAAELASLRIRIYLQEKNTEKLWRKNDERQEAKT